MERPDPGVLRVSIERRLGDLVPARADAPRIVDAMRYGLLSPGKRIRPLLALLSAADFGAPVFDAIDCGCAIEMVHSASLMLDDLPSMDDAATRRGLPTTHRRFGESVAILAAVALLNRAFGVVAGAKHVAAETRLALVNTLETAVGTRGLIGGQEIDLHEAPRLMTHGRIEELNERKTGALFRAAIETGARVAGVSPRDLDALRRFAHHLGAAFQTADDLLDSLGSAAAAGKDVKQDGAKPTLVSLSGPDAARGAVQRHVGAALQILDDLPAQHGVLRTFVATTFVEVVA